MLWDSLPPKKSPPIITVGLIFTNKCNHLRRTERKASISDAHYLRQLLLQKSFTQTVVNFQYCTNSLWMNQSPSLTPRASDIRHYSKHRRKSSTHRNPLHTVSDKTYCLRFYRLSLETSQYLLAPSQFTSPYLDGKTAHFEAAINPQTQTHYIWWRIL